MEEMSDINHSIIKLIADVATGKNLNHHLINVDAGIKDLLRIIEENSGPGVNIEPYLYYKNLLFSLREDIMRGLKYGDFRATAIE
ncbi:hypothetical protein ACTHQF_06695 [Pedobacter sp. SAFR-022]|uniref:hypothetical protein n=1 Tax=Pedobacter sp. SAFR-022 TaxID=3436861 RepID=UPI003F81BA4B